jgi:integrase
VGRVTYYQHHGSWYLYFRDGQGVQRPRVGRSETAAERAAALKNVELTTGIPLDPDLRRQCAPEASRPHNLNHGDLVANVASLLSGLMQLGQQPVTPLSLRCMEGGAASLGQAAPQPGVSLASLRQAFLDHHEHVQHSALSTIVRYTAATQHLLNFAEQKGITDAHLVSGTAFLRYLRDLEVAPNGHANARRKPLTDKGIKFILQTCGALYRFGIAHKHIPKQTENPFAGLGLRRMKVRDSKPIFVFDEQAELKFFQAADAWSFALHFTLCKSGLRSGELVHTLIEDVDLNQGWLRVRSKPELGWTIKAGGDRDIPLAPEVVDLLKRVVGDRTAGPLFLRMKIGPKSPPAIGGDRSALARIARSRLEESRIKKRRRLSRREEAQVRKRVWHDAGAIPVGRVRSSFIRIAKLISIEATCPKSWRHTFATLLQDANVDLLIRQITLGHQPARPDQSALGMTGVYTHTQPEVQHREILRALQLRPKSLNFAAQQPIPTTLEVHK